jgi:uncharacterized membrane protein
MINKTHLIIMALICGVSAAIGAYYYPHLPNPAPTHWNLHGQVDGYGPPWVAAYMLPLVCLGMIVLLAVLPLMGPFRENFERFHVTYGRICIAIMAAFATLQLLILLAATGKQMNMGSSLCIVIGVLFAILGNWMGKVRRNFYVGIRTPWTLANDEVWEKTHRNGGKIMVTVGLIAAVTGFLASDATCFIVLMGGIGFLVVWAMGYSLYWYRRLGKMDDLAVKQ